MKRAPRTGLFLSLRQAEAEFGLPYSRLWSWVDAGQLARLDPDVAGRSIMIRRADLEGFLNRNMTGGRS